MTKLINSFLSAKGLTIISKIFFLFILLALLLVGFNGLDKTGTLIRELRNTNLANLIVWSYWWPIIIILSIFFGRIWCMICPVELITSIFAKIGIKTKPSKFIKNGWAITIFYILILLVGINIFEIHRNPVYMAYYLLSIVAISIIAGFIYEKNTFCRYFCPVGYVLGLYSRLSFFGLRVGNKKICESCKDKSCISKNHTYNLEVKSCGVGIYPAEIKDNTDCILCAGCIKACEKHNDTNQKGRPNPRFRYIGFAHDLFKINKLKLSEFVFIFLVSGFVIYEILSEYNFTKELLLMIPELIISSLGIENKIVFSILNSFFLFVMIPAVLWFIPYLVSRTKKNKLGFKEYLINFSLAYLPLIAAAHLAKALIKMTSRMNYIEYSIKDVFGLKTAQAIYNGTIKIPKTSESIYFIVTILISTIFLFGLVYSFRTVKKINFKVLKNSTIGDFYYLIPIVYSSFFIITLILWRWVNL